MTHNQPIIIRNFNYNLSTKCFFHIFLIINLKIFPCCYKTHSFLKQEKLSSYKNQLKKYCNHQKISSSQTMIHNMNSNIQKKSIVSSIFTLHTIIKRIIKK